MEDLLFKNIPAEGFDPNCGFTDRISNPTPSRSNPESTTGHEQRHSVDNRMSNVQTRDSSITGYSGVTDRLSNATPSRRNLSNEPVSQSPQVVFNDRDGRPITLDQSRVSNATPTRRVAVGSSPYTSPSADDYSRASNPTPTRRSTENIYEAPKAPQNVTIPSHMTEDVESRLSNTTPTHRERSGSSPFFDSNAAESLTFESADNPYGVEVKFEIDDSRASNPTPTRRIVQAQESPVQEEGFNFDNDRLSNYIPSQHK